MNIGIVCYASVGGSGIVATELGKALARRAATRCTSSAPRRRSGSATSRPGLSFHQVLTPTLSAVSRAAVPAVARQQDRAGGARVQPRHRPRALRGAARDRRVPGASRCWRRPAGRRRSVVTTLHGTDITLVGSDPSYSRDRRVLDRAVGRASRRCRRACATSTYAELGVTRDIDVIPNFLDCARARRQRRARSAQAFHRRRSDGAKIVIHVSNFRPVKRIDCGDGDLRSHPRAACRRGCCSSATVPSWRGASGLARELGIVRSDRCRRRAGGGGAAAVGQRTSSCCRQRRRASAWRRSKRWRARCPVVASRVGGLPEVIEHGVSGFLHPLEALDEMAASAIELLTDPVLHVGWRRPPAGACASEFCVERVVPMYEACYRELLS